MAAAISYRIAPMVVLNENRRRILLFTLLTFVAMA